MTKEVMEEKRKCENSAEITWKERGGGEGTDGWNIGGQRKWQKGE